MAVERIPSLSPICCGFLTKCIVSHAAVAGMPISQRGYKKRGDHYAGAHIAEMRRKGEELQ